MAKDAGMGDQFYIDGYDIGGDIQSLQRIGGGPNSPLGATDITQGAMARFGGQLYGGMGFTSYHNVAANQEHARLSTLPRTDVVATWGHGTTLGNASASCVAKQINYDPNRGQNGELLFSVDLESNAYGLTFGQMLTAGKRTDTAATNGTSVDLGTVSPGAFGLVMFVHVFAFTGTSVTIKIQESSDNGSGDAFADVVGATTGALSAIGAVRVQTGLINVERYLRVVTTGTFNPATFWVQATRFDTSVVF